MKKLLFTGASGFLGYNIRPILEKTYDVHTIGLTDDDDIKINMAKEVPPINSHYDVVLHAAGKAEFRDRDLHPLAVAVDLREVVVVLFAFLIGILHTQADGIIPLHLHPCSREILHTRLAAEAFE